MDISGTGAKVLEQEFLIDFVSDAAVASSSEGDERVHPQLLATRLRLDRAHARRHRVPLAQ